MNAKKDKHTPGPWKVSGTSKSLQRFHVGNDDENVCAVFTSLPDAEANAKLIAAAPAMKELLERLVEWNKNNNLSRDEALCLSSEAEQLLKQL